ncbi:AmmeMemoRadiSam system protein B, partial [Pseudomonadota bacterium]
MEKIKLFVLSVLCVSALSACQSDSNAEVSSIEEPASANTIQGLLLPHHLLVAEQMEKVYSSVVIENNYDRIIVISPNHFDTGFNYIQSTDIYSDVGLPIPGLDMDFINYLYEERGLFIESKYFSEEHGIYAHFGFLNEHFPDAKLVPIIIKKYTPKERLDHLVAAIAEKDLSRTLIIASIDFTHFADEKLAVKDDERTVAWLNDWSENQGPANPFNEIVKIGISSDIASETAVAMDSTETF